MKKITVTFFFLALVFNLIAQITPQEAVVLMQRGINLGNTLEAPNEGEWYKGKAQEYFFDDYKDAGFATVRIPVRWDKHTETTAPYTIDEAWMDRVEQVVNWGLEHDLFIIINTHHEDWIKLDYQNEKDRFDAIWTQVSERFKDKSEKLFFEMINEPVVALADGSTKGLTKAENDELNARVLGIIRETNPTRIVIFSGNGWSNSPDLLNAAIPEDDYLMGYFHSYDPWKFAGEAKGTWGTESDRNAIKIKFDEVKQWSTLNNIPVLIGEFGAMVSCDYNSRMIHYTTYVEEAIAHGFAFTVWDDAGWFKIYEREERDWSEVKDIVINAPSIAPEWPQIGIILDTCVHISWANRMANYDSIQIVRKELDNEYELIATLDGKATEYDDLKTFSSSNYYYKLIAFAGEEETSTYPFTIYIKPTKREPYSGTPAPIPGTIEAENFDKGGEGLTFHDIDGINEAGALYRDGGVDIEARSEGGYQIGYIATEEWYEYTINVEEAGEYLVNAYVASLKGSGKFNIKFGGNKKTPTLTVPNTGDWTTLESVSGTVELNAGEQIMRIDILDATEGFNIDRIQISKNITSIEAVEDGLITVYPNPASQQLFINNNNTALNADINILNVNGKVIKSLRIDKANQVVNITDLASGVYFIQIKSGNSVTQQKFMKL